MIHSMNRLRDSATLFAFMFFAFALSAIPAVAQRAVSRDPAEPPQGKPRPKQLARPAGGAGRQAVGKKYVRAFILKLVAWGTRLTLFSQPESQSGGGSGPDVIVT